MSIADFIKCLIAVALCMGQIGCQLISYSTQSIDGQYRWGNDIDNAQYLTLYPSGKFTLFERSNQAVEQEVEPFDTVLGVGQWTVAKRHVILEPKKNSKRWRSPKKLGIEVMAGQPVLVPQYGAGWMPSDGFKKITEVPQLKHKSKRALEGLLNSAG
jgi:hypothetical protein